VATDKSHYGPNETITVTIANGLTTTIITQDHKSNCTTVTLERRTGAAWQPQNPCRLMSATRLIRIGPSSTLQQQLLPPGNTSPGWAVGTYRVAFSYYVGSVSASGTTILSASFTVG
jgi:hypothetical protein